MEVRGSTFPHCTGTQKAVPMCRLQCRGGSKQAPVEGISKPDRLHRCNAVRYCCLRAPSHICTAATTEGSPTALYGTHPPLRAMCRAIRLQCRLARLTISSRWRTYSCRAGGWVHAAAKARASSTWVLPSSASSA